jgi:ADP-ribose pyrophosphatase YjhB (NUDIX family)
MEMELLNQMIHDRDRRIASIKQKMEEQHEKMAKFQEELIEIKRRREESEIAHMEELTRLMEEKEVGERALGRLQEDLKKQQGDSLQLYAEVIKKDAAKIPDATDSSYVMRMQAQLCKCMHSMGIMENQTELVKKTCDELIKSLKDAVNRTIDEKTNVELKFMNDLVMTDNARREMEEQMKEKLDKLREQIAEVEEKLEDLESDSESDSEIDEEEEEEKELIKKELKERNDEIANLQKQIDAQKIKIQKLENGEDIPEDKAPTEEQEGGNELTEDESTDSNS